MAARKIGKYFIKLTGFNTLDEAKGFLKWFEGQGEQDETLGEWVGRYGKPVKYVSVIDAHKMIALEDGFEYPVEITYYEEPSKEEYPPIPEG